MKNKRRTHITKVLAIALTLAMTSAALVSCGQSESGGNYKGNKNEYQMGDVNQNIAGDNRYETNDGKMNTDATAEEGYNTQQYPNTEEYNHLTENGFKMVSENPLSTFSTDVDTASYTNVRRMINEGWKIDPDAVRTEEFINYFKYNYEKPTDDAVSITTELSYCPWNDEAKLMLVGLQAKEAEVEDVPTNLVFLIDVSGSMEDETKLPLVREAFSMLSGTLKPNDRISIVTYAGSDQVVLEGESGDNKDKICDALDSLSAGGSTAGAAGITTAYELAEKYFIEGGNNRVLLATDGDLNVGLSTEEELTALIEEKRESGVFLSVLGFGMGNYKDNRLEALADNGNGNYAYIDSLDEAERVLVTELSGTLFTVAKDAKVQVEFNPSNVSAYRLVGYENRLMNDEDFNDDTKDAGDIGSGQQVTALYEIIPTEDCLRSGKTSSIDLKYQSDDIRPELVEEGETKLDGELLTVSIRYKEPDAEQSKLIKKAVLCDNYTAELPDNLRFACAVAEFSMILRNSEYVNGISAADILDDMEKNGYGDEDFIELVRTYVHGGDIGRDD